MNVQIKITGIYKLCWIKFTNILIYFPDVETIRLFMQKFTVKVILCSIHTYSYQQKRINSNISFTETNIITVELDALRTAK